jgi:hypothetical protein
MYIFMYSLFLALHVSGAIYTHPQDHKLQDTAIGVCMVLVHKSTSNWTGPLTEHVCYQDVRNHEHQTR